MPTPTHTTTKRASTATSFDDVSKLIGDFWTLRIVGTLESAELRFCELERHLPDINPVTLSGRLKKLESAGVIQRNCCVQDKQSVSYCLSTKGRDLLPVLNAIEQFAQRHKVSG
jgi:DNA-binding HxlR family transcriptional regulator